MGNADQILGNVAGIVVVSIVILVILFLVFRELFCWYWKINERVALLIEIRNLLAAGGRLQNGMALGASKQASTGKFCSKCGAVVAEGGSDFCQSCGATL